MIYLLNIAFFSIVKYVKLLKWHVQRETVWISGIETGKFSVKTVF
jgi:hypothetical protein